MGKLAVGDDHIGIGTGGQGDLGGVDAPQLGVGHLGAVSNTGARQRDVGILLIADRGDHQVADVAVPDGDILLLGHTDGQVVAAIRPEGFDPCRDGRFTCRLKRVEVMGRDISVVCNHDAFTGEDIRAIVDSEELSGINGTTVSFNLKKNKVYLFKPDGERLKF